MTGTRPQRYTLSDRHTGATPSVTLIPQGTGRDVSAQVSGIPAGVMARLVVGRDGSGHQVDQSVIDGAGSARVATTTIRTDEITSVAVEDSAGQVYVSTPIT